MAIEWECYCGFIGNTEDIHEHIRQKHLKEAILAFRDKNVGRRDITPEKALSAFQGKRRA